MGISIFIGILAGRYNSVEVHLVSADRKMDRPNIVALCVPHPPPPPPGVMSELKLGMMNLTKGQKQLWRNFPALTDFHLEKLNSDLPLAMGISLFITCLYIYCDPHFFCGKSKATDFY
jgi:hypothetical protein